MWFTSIYLLKPSFTAFNNSSVVGDIFLLKSVENFFSWIFKMFEFLLSEISVLEELAW